MSRELLRQRLVNTTDEQAIRSLHKLFFIVERMDVMAYQPGPDGMVKVTAAMWRDQISPDIQVVRNALDRQESEAGSDPQGAHRG